MELCQNLYALALGKYQRVGLNKVGRMDAGCGDHVGNLIGTFSGRLTFD